MNEIVLQTHHVTKMYKNQKAVDQVSMTIQKGDIYGLIGRNGAGKTTLIRMITSLVKPTTGEISLFGEKEASRKIRLSQQIGSVIESPAFYPNLTAEQNLHYYRKAKGIIDDAIIKKVLGTVQLENTGNKKFHNFSLGMKQRLGLALALLGKPNFLILDEPTNGLDPMGISQMRQLLQKLNQEQGLTILVSSHILSELSLFATRYGIIESGQLIKQITHKELVETNRQSLIIKVSDVNKAARILEEELQSSNFKVINSEEIRLYDLLDVPSKIITTLAKNDLEVFSVTENSDNLENYFLALIGEDK